MLYYVKRKDIWTVEKDFGQLRRLEHYPLDWDYIWPEVYELYEDEVGIKTVLLSEIKLANHIDYLKKVYYDLGVIWDFKIDPNL